MGSQGLSVPAVEGDVQGDLDDHRERPEGHGGETLTMTAPATGVLPVPRETAPRPGRAPRRRTLPALYPLALGAADGLAMAAAVTWTAAVPAAATPAAAACAVAVNAAGGLNRCRRRPSLAEDAPALAVRAALVAALVCAAFRAGFPQAAATWFWIACLYCALAGTGRLVVHTAVRAYRRLRRRGRPTILIGAGPASAHVAAVLRRRRDFGLDPAGQILAGDPGDPPAAGLPVLGRPLDLRRAVEAHGTATVVIVAEDVPRSRLDPLVRVCTALACETLLVPATADLLVARAGSRTGRAPVEHLEGVPYLRLGPRPGERAARTAKRVFDVAAAIVVLLLVWPVLLACALAVRLEGGPGVLFRQRRVGLGGRTFTLLKFRSLRPADDHEADTRWSVDGDARMGPVGRFLRETSLDELPQLWNVIRGDMSLVGPRPERPHFVRLFSETCPEYALRHRMPVGITGWAQVNGLRGDTSIELRVRLDNRYIDTWTFGADLRILLMTVRAVLTRNVP
ncbi:hypothetical protein GCM10010191_57420 [Actinomadura vinacea]|uniref:Bacterial sugar transferase domain-containing protein n=1 Tax=Actinomadura vinacea TaxID=115336 RepID=A0ABN3JPA6_9ACTN